jgi:hypothetical protein
VTDLSRILSGISALKKQAAEVEEGQGGEGGPAERTGAAAERVVAKAKAALADGVVTGGEWGAVSRQETVAGDCRRHQSAHGIGSGGCKYRLLSFAWMYGNVISEGFCCMALKLYLET